MAQQHAWLTADFTKGVVENEINILYGKTNSMKTNFFHKMYNQPNSYYNQPISTEIAEVGLKNVHK